MALILAIEPDRRQAARLADLVRTRVQADLVLAETTEGALGAIGNRVPDLVLVPTLISPQDDAALAGALRVIATAAHVNMLTIPVLADMSAAPPKPSGLFGRFRKQPQTAPAGCDPSVFAEQIKSYLKEREMEADEDEFDIDDVEQVCHTPPIVVDTPAITEAPVAVEPVFAMEAAAPVETPVYEAPVFETPTYQTPAYETPVYEPPVYEPPAVLQPPIVVEQPLGVEASAFARDTFQASYGETSPQRPDIQGREGGPVFAIEREHEEAVTYDPPPQTVYAQPIEVEEVEPVAEIMAAPVIEEPFAPVFATEVVEEAVVPAAAIEPPVVEMPSVHTPIVEKPIVQKPAVEMPAWAALDIPKAPPVAELLEDDDPIVLAILNYVPKPLPEPKVTPTPEPKPEPKPELQPAAYAATAEAAAPLAPPAPSAPLSQAELDKRYFAESGAKPPTPPAPRRKPKPQRPEWSELVASLRVDVERMKAEGTEPAKRAHSGVRPVAAAAATPAPPRRKAPKPIQDQWGLFDPEQCGFAALLAKLEEITEAPSDGTSVRVIS